MKGTYRMTKVAYKDKLTAIDVAEQVIERLGKKKLKWAKEEYKGAELRIWVKMQVGVYGHTEASLQLQNRAITKVIEYMHSDL